MTQLLTDIDGDIDFFLAQLNDPTAFPNSVDSLVIPPSVILTDTAPLTDTATLSTKPPAKKRVRPHVNRDKPLTRSTDSILTTAIAQTIPDLPVLVTANGPTQPAITNPLDYVLDVYDNYVAPGITGNSPTLEKIRRALYRRAVAEFAREEIRILSAAQQINVEDLMTITVSSLNKAGLQLV